MPAYVVFLRAVNIAPRWVKMARLRELLVEDGFTRVETYIQSGNVRCSTRMRSSARVRDRLERLIETEFGFPVVCVVRTPAQLGAIAAYADSLTSPLTPADIEQTERRYVTLVAEPLTQDQLELCAGWREPGERLHGHGGEIYWWLGKPSHQAKFGNARLGGSATTRDLKVIRELANRWVG